VNEEFDDIKSSLCSISIRSDVDSYRIFYRRICSSFDSYRIFYKIAPIKLYF